MSVLAYHDLNLMQVWDEIKLLFPAHYDELCVTKDFPLDPDYDAYQRLQDAGMLRCIVCRIDEKLAGYIVFTISPHLHYNSCKTAFENVYYVAPQYRKGRVGIKLFQYAEKVLKDMCGVQRIIMQTKVHMDNSRLFEYLGYKHTDKLFTKLL